MKKILFLCAAMIIASCSTNSAFKEEGIKNAEQFVKVQSQLNQEIY